MRLQTISFEGGLAEPEIAALLAFRYDPPQPFLNKGLHSCTLFVSQFPRLFKKVVRYLYGCLHMGIYISMYGRGSI